MRWSLVLWLGLATRPCDGACGDKSWHTADLTLLARLALKRWPWERKEAAA